MHRGHGGKKRQSVLDGEVEDFLYVLALEADFQGFPVVAFALADIAGDIDIREKMHFHLDHAVALTGLAASALDVEAEPASFVAARARFRDGREELAYRREQTGVGGRVGPRRAPDRALIDLDHPIDEVQALDAIKVGGAGRGM